MLGTREDRLLVGGTEDSAQGKADLVKGTASLPSISTDASEGRTKINVGILGVGRLLNV